MQSTAASVADGLDISKYDDWVIFDERIEEMIHTALLRRIPALRTIHTRDEEWYLEPSSGEFYVYVKPDDKILPKWERVDVFSQAREQESKDIREVGLKVIPTGEIDKETVIGLRFVLGTLVDEGKVEVISDYDSSLDVKRGTETWYREFLTDSIYRLVENTGAGRYCWERVSTNVSSRIPQ